TKSLALKPPNDSAPRSSTARREQIEVIDRFIRFSITLTFISSPSHQISIRSASSLHGRYPPFRSRKEPTDFAFCAFMDWGQCACCFKSSRDSPSNSEVKTG